MKRWRRRRSLCAVVWSLELAQFALEKKYDIPSFARHLASFCKRERASVLKKSGMKRRFRYRFTDPLMQPFVIMKGLADGKQTH
jgi:hypothetical protein